MNSSEDAPPRTSGLPNMSQPPTTPPPPRPGSRLMFASTRPVLRMTKRFAIYGGFGALSCTISSLLVSDTPLSERILAAPFLLILIALPTALVLSTGRSTRDGTLVLGALFALGIYWVVSESYKTDIASVGLVLFGWMIGPVMAAVIAGAVSSRNPKYVDAPTPSPPR